MTSAVIATAPPGTRNAALAYATLDHITAHPETWNQRGWVCGTSACFAGWAVRLSGGHMDPKDGLVTYATPGTPAEHLLGEHAEEAAIRLLGITEDIAQGDDPVRAVARTDGTWVPEWLFSPHHNLDTLIRRITAVFGPRPAADR